jgi:hypothetical protein
LEEIASEMNIKSNMTEIFQNLAVELDAEKAVDDVFRDLKEFGFD